MSGENDAYGPAAAAFYDSVYATLRGGCGDVEFRSWPAAQADS